VRSLRSLAKLAGWPVSALHLSAGGDRARIPKVVLIRMSAESD